MRIIKFRVWDKPRKEYLKFNMAIAKGGAVFSIFDEYLYDEFTDEVIVEQYTGVDDVNGNPVYEGDIVKVYRQWTDEVGFINGSFGLFPNRYHPFVSLDELNGAMELLGNIHENPELLEAD